MDNNSSELFQSFMRNMETEDSGVIADCLSNSIVIRNICQHFSNTELLKLSLVNKLWNFEARCELRKRKNLLAYLKAGADNSCEDLHAFGTDLSQMNVVPFSGINLAYWKHPDTCQKGMRHMTYEAILNHITLKKVFIQLNGEWYEHKDCPTFLLAKKIIEHFSCTLEELSLKIYDGKEDFIRDVVQGYRFTHLKTLKLDEHLDTTDEADMKYMKKLVDLAPNLQKFYNYGHIEYIDQVLEGTSAVLVLKTWFIIPFDQLPESVIRLLRLEAVVLEYNDTEFDIERFKRLLPMLLQASSTTLQHLQMDTLLALPLMCCGVCFSNVRALIIAIHESEFAQPDQRIFRIIKGFNFTGIFPNLKRIVVSDCSFDLERLPDHINAFIDQANVVYEDPWPDRAVKIQELKLRFSEYLPDSMVQFFAEMFPSIEKLDVYQDEDFGFSFASFFNHWADLKELKVTVNFGHSFPNLDCAFCGIFPEEVAELREKDEEYLKSVNIVPVMPAITCLKSLRALQICFRQELEESESECPTFIFSKVAELVAFAKCRYLAVTLRPHNPEVSKALSHTQNYASVVPEEDWNADLDSLLDRFE